MKSKGTFSRVLLLMWITALMGGALFAAFSCGDDDDDDDDGTPSEDDDDAVDDDDADDDDDAADDDATDDDATDDDDDDDDDDDVISGTIAYIWDDDDALALAFETFLTEVGYTVELYPISSLSAKVVPDFSEIDLFISDNTTDNGWDETNSLLLTGTGKPIIACADGLTVFDWLGMYLESGHAMGMSDVSGFVPMNLSHDLWNTPNNLGIETADAVDILTSDGHARGLYNDGSSPAGVEFLGQAAYTGPEKYDPYYVIAVQDGKYALWGFGENGPDDYTQTGKDLYVNLIEYLRSGK